MTMPPRPTEVIHDCLRAVLRPGDLAIDATAGNGHDTLLLSQSVGPQGRVIAYDIQKSAIDSTRARLAAQGCSANVVLHHMSHAHMADHAAPGSVAAVVFNLGYLPGHDHETTTRTPETLMAIEAATTLLRPGGLLGIICYPGHAEGADESVAVENLLIRMAADGWNLSKYQPIGTRRPAPFAFIACSGRAVHCMRQEKMNSSVK